MPMTTMTMLDKMKNFEVGIETEKKTLHRARERRTGYACIGGACCCRRISEGKVKSDSNFIAGSTFRFWRHFASCTRMFSSATNRRVAVRLFFFCYTRDIPDKNSRKGPGNSYKSCIEILWKPDGKLLAPTEGTRFCAGKKKKSKRSPFSHVGAYSYFFPHTNNNSIRRLFGFA